MISMSRLSQKSRICNGEDTNRVLHSYDFIVLTIASDFSSPWKHLNLQHLFYFISSERKIQACISCWQVNSFIPKVLNQSLYLKLSQGGLVKVLSNNKTRNYVLFFLFTSFSCFFGTDLQWELIFSDNKDRSYVHSPPPISFSCLIGTD